MARGSFGLFAFALVVVACGSTPTQLMCPTTAQSLTFKAAGSCGGGAATGTVTISTQPGLCSLLVMGGPAVGLPSQGQFLGSASETNYDLTKGNWSLFVNEGNSTDGSELINCDESEASGVVNLACSGMVCPPDDGCGVQCSTVNCVEHLTPKK
jgi:hypothetical protein